MFIILPGVIRRIHQQKAVVWTFAFGEAFKVLLTFALLAVALAVLKWYFATDRDAGFGAGGTSSGASCN